MCIDIPVPHLDTGIVVVIGKAVQLSIDIGKPVLTVIGDSRPSVDIHLPAGLVDTLACFPHLYVILPRKVLLVKGEWSFLLTV